MKLEAFKQDVLSTGTEQTNYSMEMNGASFSIMSDMLYQHKIAAVVRELICNAADSHIDAGKKDTPIKVILPNQFNPNFVIEDFGVGLNDEEARTIFAGYFKSTKQQSNDVTGSFGLGSKVGFSYSKTFNVLCRKDGEETLYNCYVNEDWIPSISKIYSKDTDEGNGVRITIPVKEKDFQAFRNEAKVIFSFITVPVHVTDESFSLMIDDATEQLKEKGYVSFPLYSSSDLYRGHLVYALMGGVLYPLPHQYSQVSGFGLAFNPQSQGSTAIHFDIGELKPAASRESLSMDEVTKKKVEDRIECLVRGILKETQDKIDDAPNIFEAFKSMESCSYDHLRYFTYKNKKLLTYTRKPFGIQDIFDSLSVYRIDSRVDGKFCSKMPMVDYAEITSIPDAYGLNRTNSVYAFYRDDGTSSGFVTKTRRYARENFRERTVVLEFNQELSEHQMDRISSLLGGEMKWFGYSEVKEALKEDPKERSYKENKEKKDTTVYGVAWNSHSYLRGDNHDVVDRKVYSVNRSISYPKTISIGGTLYDPTDIASLLTTYHEESVLLISRTTTNEKKLDRLGVETLTEDLLNECLESLSDELEVAVLKDRYILTGSEDSISFQDSSLRTASRYANDLELKKLEDEISEKVKKVKKINIPYGIMKSHTPTSDLIDRINSMKKKYSMVGGHGGYLLKKDGSMVGGSEVLAKMIAFCEENGYTVQDMIEEI